MRPTAFPLETGVMSPSFSQGILLVHSSIITKRNTFRIDKNITRLSFSPWVGKIPWRKKWQPILVFFPGKFMDRGVWWATVHRVAKSWT